MIKSLQRDFHHTKSRQPAAETLPTPNQPKVEDGTIEEDNEDANHDADGQDEPDDNGEKWEDHEDDCIIDASYCRLRMKILYENGWHTGEIKYCNNHLQTYYVKFRGDYTKWLKFIDSFKASIHSSTTLSSIDNFNYLRGYAGDALNTIDGPSLTNDTTQRQQNFQ